MARNSGRRNMEPANCCFDFVQDREILAALRYQSCGEDCTGGGGKAEGSNGAFPVARGRMTQRRLRLTAKRNSPAARQPPMFVCMQHSQTVAADVVPFMMSDRSACGCGAIHQQSISDRKDHRVDFRRSQLKGRQMAARWLSDHGSRIDSMILAN